MKISDFADLGLEQIPPADTEEADAKIKDYYASLSPARKEKADAIKSRSSRRQSICAGHLLEDMLRVLWHVGEGQTFFRGRSIFPVTL